MTTHAAFDTDDSTPDRDHTCALCTEGSAHDTVCHLAYDAWRDDGFDLGGMHDADAAVAWYGRAVDTRYERAVRGAEPFAWPVVDLVNTRTGYVMIPNATRGAGPQLVTEFLARRGADGWPNRGRYHLATRSPVGGARK